MNGTMRLRMPSFVLAVLGNASTGLPPSRHGRSAHEVRVAADAAVQPFADRVGHGLSGQVDFDGRVDGHDPVVLGNDPRIVGVLGRVHFDHRVVVQEVEQLLAAGGETADDLALVQRLVLAGDHALVDQPNDAVGEHLGVDAQVVAVGQFGQHRVGQPADAQLQGVAVRDQAGHVAGDLACRFVGVVDDGPGEQRLVVRHEVSRCRARE